MKTVKDRLTVEIPTAFEIAALVKGCPIDQGASLIEQYAKTVASGAVVDATATAYDRALGLLKAAS